jgi:DNA-damage-inducible protein D
MAEAEKVERINIRGEVSDREKSLSSVVHSRGINNMGFFQNAGYRGMYNCNMRLKDHTKDLKKLDKKGKPTKKK